MDTSKSFEEQANSLVKNHKLKLENSRRDVILLLGRTGVGKSTMADILFGDVSALEATLDEDLLCMKIKNAKASPGMKDESMFQSDTICPQLFIDPTQPNLAIYDCPGFADTRGTSNEIATGVYLSEIFQHAEQVKLVASVDYDTVKPNADRDKFTDKILSEVLDFVLDNNFFDGGAFLLITKYANPLEKKRSFEDKIITRSIVEFLKKAQEHAVTYSKDEKRKQAICALFEKSWLQQTSDGNYPNIAFSRTIIEEGKLSDMELYTRRDIIRNQLLVNPLFKFKPSDPKHFGSPISDAAKLTIRNVLRKRVNEVEGFLKTVGRKVVKKFIESSMDHTQLSNYTRQYSLFSKDLKTHTEADSGSIMKVLEFFRKFGNNIGADIEADIRSLDEITKCLKHLSSVDIETSAAIWNDAGGKLKQAEESIAKDLLIEFRRAQGNLVAKFKDQLETVRLRIETRISILNSNVSLQHFSPSELTNSQPRLSYSSLKILRDFGNNIGADVNQGMDELAITINCLMKLTEVDVEQSSSTWSDVCDIWKYSLVSIDKTVALVIAQRSIDWGQLAVQVLTATVAGICGVAYVLAQDSD